MNQYISIARKKSLLIKLLVQKCLVKLREKYEHFKQKLEKNDVDQRGTADNE